MPLEPVTGTVITSAWLSVWLKRRIWTWDALVGVATETLVWTETNQNNPALGFIHTLNPKTIFEWLAPNISLQYHPRITHWGHESKGNYHYLKNLLIDTRILLVGILGDVRRTVWRMCILILGCKGLNGKLIFFSYEWQPCLCIASAINCRLQTKFLNNICTEQMSRQRIEIHMWLRTEIQWQIIICSTSCFLTESFLESNEGNILFSPDWLIRLSYRLLGFLKRKKKLFQLKVDFLLTSTNELLQMRRIEQ